MVGAARGGSGPILLPHAAVEVVVGVEMGEQVQVVSIHD